jgi:hypothetical protein
VIALLVAAMAGTAADGARTAAGAYPDDYGAQVAWAQAAAAEGAWAEALAGWEAAWALAGGTLEAGVGRVVALEALGRDREAAQVARRLTVTFPEAASAWTVRASAARGPSALADTVAEPWLARAESLDPTDVPRCDLARLRLRLGGDAWGPGAAGCEGVLRDAWDVWGAAFLVGMGRSGDDVIDGGAAGLAQVGASWRDRLWFDASWRSLGWHTTTDVGWVEQHEAWLRVGGGLRGAGATLIGGGLWPGGASTYTSPTWVIGGKAWGTAWATVSLEGAYSVHPDGTGWQLGGDVSVPVTDRLRVSAGLQHTALDAGTSSASWSGRASVGWEARTWDLAATGRWGLEDRPVRLDEPSAWNFTAPMGGSGDVSLGVQVAPRLRLRFGYEVARLVPDGADASVVQVGTVGFVVTDDERR